jgi:hypothetical protein
MGPISDRYLENDGEFIVPAFCSIPPFGSSNHHDRTPLELRLIPADPAAIAQYRARGGIDVNDPSAGFCHKNRVRH